MPPPADLELSQTCKLSVVVGCSCSSVVVVVVSVEAALPIGFPNVQERSPSRLSDKDHNDEVDFHLLLF